MKELRDQLELGLEAVDSNQLHLVDKVCTHLLTRSDNLQASDLMLLGAHCRDLLHQDVLHKAQHRTFRLRGTEDLDIALAIADWTSYADIIDGLPTVGDTGIRYRVESIPTDLVPFGPIEDPTGVISPQSRTDKLSVWAYKEVFDNAYQLPLPQAGTIRIPTISGYTALKLAAWLDRSENNQYKDAPDIAAAIYWYTGLTTIHNLLYTEERGIELLARYDFDRDLAASHLLGEEMANDVGVERCTELALRWPGPRSNELLRNMDIATDPAEWSQDVARRQELVSALTAGWSPAS